MIRLCRLPWHHGAMISLLSLKNYKGARKDPKIWRQAGGLSFHLFRLNLGSLCVLRLRPTADHMKRLGLPIV